MRRFQGVRLGSERMIINTFEVEEWGLGLGQERFVSYWFCRQRERVQFRRLVGLLGDNIEKVGEICRIRVGLEEGRYQGELGGVSVQFDNLNGVV